MNYKFISVMATMILVTSSLVPVFASPYALQNPTGTSNSTTATSGNATSPPVTSSSGGITVTTDRSSYRFGDTLTISGSTQDYITDTAITLKIVNPQGNIAKFDQIALGTDRTYSISFAANTDLWQLSGTYQVFVQFGSKDRTAMTTFYFAGSSGGQGPPLSTLPSPPTNLVATASSSSEVDLNWLAPQNTGGIPLLGYKIERNDGNGFNIIASSLTTTYQDKNLIPNSEHSYRVSAINSIGSSTPSNPFPIIMPSSPTPIQTPSKIPSWVRHIFIYYGQGDVSEDELLGAIKFLINQGIMKLS